MAKILIVDDERNISEMVAHALEPHGFDADRAHGGLPAIDRIREDRYDLVITDVMMADADGFAVLDVARQQDDPPAVIVMTGFGTIDSAVKAMKLGAAEYLTKPLDIPRLIETVQKLLQAREAAGRAGGGPPGGGGDDAFTGLVGQSQAMRGLCDLIERVARMDSTALISGESGTGKELVARAIHDKSGRRGGPFIAVDCGALTETLLESELFGHVRGAFTGAVEDKTGLFEAAHGGTLFLDEIGEMTPRVQQKLLRTLQERTVRAIGSTRVRDIDVRIVSATNRNLAELVAGQEFRQDLYYRLNVVPIPVPALRERREDIPLLARHFAEKTARRMRRPPSISEAVLGMLGKADWPGNVRQLENVIECAVTFTEGDEIQPEHLPPDFVESFALTAGRGTARPEAGSVGPSEITPLGAAIRYLEHQMLAKALDASNGNKEQAAGLLGIDRATLYRKLKTHKLNDGG